MMAASGVDTSTSRNSGGRALRCRTLAAGAAPSDVVSGSGAESRSLPVEGHMVQHIAFFVSRSLASVLLVSAALVAVSAPQVRAQDRTGQHAPEVPTTLEVPEGHRPFLIARAVGT